MFASVEGTNSALAAIAAHGDVPRVLLPGSSRDPAAFAGITVPEGMTVLGTSPASTARESEDFDALYLDITGEEATDLARQAYDAVYIATLAAIGTNSTSNTLTAASMFVANPPGEIVGPGDFSHAAEVVAEGTEIDYTGISGFVDLSAAFEVSKGTLEVWRLQGGETLTYEVRDVDAAAEVGTEVPSGSLVRSSEAHESPLVLGIIAEIDPDTGDPTGPVGTGALIAVSEINDAGGAFGLDVEIVAEEPSQGAAQLLLDAGANVIIGPTDADSTAEAVVAATAVGVPVFAFVATPVAGGGFIRMTPPETLQTAVLANLAGEMQPGVACVLYESGVGDALAASFQAAMEHKGGTVRENLAYAAGDDLGELVNKCLGG